MRPAPIPDEAIWEGAERRVISPPGGDLTHPDVAPGEALIERAGAVPTFSFRCVLEEGDLEKFAGGGHVWITFLGHVVPFSFSVTDKDGQQ